MPVGLSSDYLLDGKPFMLVRSGASGPRSWRRTGQSDATARRTQEGVAYGNLPPEQDNPEVWNDWSGGYGYAYRSPDTPNTYHWGENVESRFPGQLTHAQRPLTVEGAYAQGFTGSYNVEADRFYDVPHTTVAEQSRPGTGAVLAIGRRFAVSYIPQGLGGNLALYRTEEQGQPGSNILGYVGRPATFGSYTLVGVTEQTGFFSRDHQAIWGIQATMPGRGFITAGNRLWRYHGPNPTRNFYLQSVAAGADAVSATNWSATLNVGPGYFDARDIITLNDQIFVGMQDGLYAGDQSGTFYNVLSGLSHQVNADNCRDLTIYDNAVVAPHVAGIFAYYPSDATAIVRQIGPGSASDRSPVRGQIRCVKSFGQWLFAGLWTGSQSYVLAGRDASPGLPFPWHVQQKLPHAAKISRIHVDGITTPSGGGRILPNRMWVATDASIDTGLTAPYYFFPIPRNHDNPLAPDVAFSANYSGSMRCDFGQTDWGAPGTPKVWRAVEVWAENFASGAQYADVYYTVDSGTRTLLGRAQTSPMTTLYFPTEDAGGSFVTGQGIALSLESYTASLNVAPVYRSIVLRGALRAKAAAVIQAQTRIADDLQDRNGTPMRPAAVMLQELRAMADGATPRKLVDLAGATSWVAVLPPIEEAESWQEGVDTPEVVAGVRMAVLNFSAA